MTRTEHLLSIAAEECAEVAQRCSKAGRFGMEEVYAHHPDKQLLRNRDRILLEFADLCAVMSMLGLVPDAWAEDVHVEQVRAKWVKVQKYLAYSQQIGTLQP